MCILFEVIVCVSALNSREQQTAYTLDGVQQTMFTVNQSFSSMNVTMWGKMNGTLLRLSKLEAQISKSEKEDEDAKKFVMNQVSTQMIG